MTNSSLQTYFFLILFEFYGTVNKYKASSSNGGTLERVTC